jgi:hypothetical protein
MNQTLTSCLPSSLHHATWKSTQHIGFPNKKYLTWNLLLFPQQRRVYGLEIRFVSSQRRSMMDFHRFHIISTGQPMGAESKQHPHMVAVDNGIHF